MTSNISKFVKKITVGVNITQDLHLYLYLVWHYRIMFKGLLKYVFFNREHKFYNKGDYFKKQNKT